ncbi:MAG: ribonuclease P protein component [Candidatus Spechtbacterales bacterium]
MLEKGRRITRGEEFKRVFSKGALVKGEFISLKVKRTGVGGARFGFIVGQKIAKKAASRNLVKRRLRAAVARLMGKIEPGVDVVLMPSEKITERSFKEITLETEKVFKKARLL